MELNFREVEVVGFVGCTGRVGLLGKMVPAIARPERELVIFQWCVKVIIMIAVVNQEQRRMVVIEEEIGLGEGKWMMPYHSSASMRDC